MAGHDDLKERLHAAYLELKRRLHERVVGMDEVIDLLLIGILSGGHCLLVGVPGLAKTLLIRAAADLLDLRFSRIQFTPDLMPSDIVGTEVIVEDAATGERTFRFMNGPVFANIVLADEINRTPPKTQAALMEAMEERQVTIGGRKHPLDPPFFVLATQNPIEQEGTYPLPAAQLDRFTFLINVDYPTKADERRILRLTTAPQVTPEGAVLTRSEILALMDLALHEEAPSDVAALATTLARRTRPDDPAAPDVVRRFVAYGVGPRGAQALVLAAKVRAMLHRRPRPAIDDVRALAPHAFRHRLILNFKGEAEGISSEAVVAAVIEDSAGGPAARPVTAARRAGS